MGMWASEDGVSEWPVESYNGWICGPVRME